MTGVQGMVFGGTGTKIAPLSRGDAVGKGPAHGIPGSYILMWRGFAIHWNGARLVKAVGDE